MGLEGAVLLGYKSELEAETDPQQREQLFDSLLEQLYQQGKAVEAAAYVELDAVIDPVDTRQVIVRALQAAGSVNAIRRSRFVDTW